MRTEKSVNSFANESMSLLTSRCSGENDRNIVLHCVATEIPSLLTACLSSFCFSASSTLKADTAVLLGGVKAFALSSLISIRFFFSGDTAFFFFAGLALAFAGFFAGFFRAFVDFALVLGLDLDFGFDVDLDLALGLPLALVFSAAGSWGAAAALEAVSLAVDAFFLGALVVRPVWAFGLDTASVAYDRYDNRVSALDIHVLTDP